MGHDNYSVRRRKAGKLRKSGLDAFLLPSFSDVDKIVRMERIAKRNLYRALESLELIRAARTRPRSPEQVS